MIEISRTSVSSAAVQPISLLSITGLTATRGHSRAPHWWTPANSRGQQRPAWRWWSSGSWPTSSVWWRGRRARSRPRRWSRRRRDQAWGRTSSPWWSPPGWGSPAPGRFRAGWGRTLGPRRNGPEESASVVMVIIDQVMYESVTYLGKTLATHQLSAHLAPRPSAEQTKPGLHTEKTDLNTEKIEITQSRA